MFKDKWIKKELYRYLIKKDLIFKTLSILPKLSKLSCLKMVNHPVTIWKMYIHKIPNKPSQITGILYGNFTLISRLSFDDLRMQFDNRIKELILNGENSLISEIVKQLYEKDDNKNTGEMKKIVIKQKVQ